MAADDVKVKKEMQDGTIIPFCVAVDKTCAQVGDAPKQEAPADEALKAKVEAPADGAPSSSTAELAPKRARTHHFTLAKVEALAAATVKPEGVKPEPQGVQPKPEGGEAAKPEGEEAAKPEGAKQAHTNQFQLGISWA